MALEVERKFLVRSEAWREHAIRSVRMAQAYLTGQGAASVRVRIAGDQANLNIKQAVAGAARLEFEYAIPLDDAETMMQTLAGARVEKVRHVVPSGGFNWEVDEFTGDNAGLIVAEIELPSTDCDFERPAWLGEEVTDEIRYYNNQLATHPFQRWVSA